MIKPLFHSLAIPAAALGAIIGASFPAKPVESVSAWQLVESFNGEEFAIDHGLTLSDCVAANGGEG